MFLMQCHGPLWMAMNMNWFLIAVVACAVGFYLRFFWAIQNDLRRRSKIRPDSVQPSHYRPPLRVKIADVLTQTRGKATSSR